MQSQKLGNNLINFLSGTQVLEEVESAINGKITVVRSLAFGTYIQVGGLTQSGGIMHQVWGKPLKKISNFQFPISNVLILGLAGGTVVKFVKKYWPDADITGVDIDSKMVELGRKYLGLDDYKVKVVINDAEKFLSTSHKPSTRAQAEGLQSIKFDLILVDLYVGDKFPQKFESIKFIHLVRNALTTEGIAIFNRLYYGEKRPRAVRFGNKLAKVFKKVDIVFPEANVMFICHS